VTESGTHTEERYTAESGTHTDERSTAEDGPNGPTKLSPRSWWWAVKRTVSRFRAEELTDVAAALTYYGVLAIFPTLLVLVSILGLIGESATNPVLDNITDIAPGPAGEILTNAIEEISGGRGAAGLALVLGLAGALWSGSGYVGAFSRASNRVYEVGEGRPFWKLRPLQIGITFVLVLLLAVSGIAVVVSGPLAREIGDVVGAGDTAILVWDLAKWPVIALIVITICSILYYAAPNVRQPGFRWITPGGVLALVVWILVSLGFAFYLSNFGSYNATYGSLAGVIIFLVWLWLSNCAILLGAVLNAELERERELEAGEPMERTLTLEPRQEPEPPDEPVHGRSPQRGAA
jgi:membrane protein